MKKSLCMLNTVFIKIAFNRSKYWFGWNSITLILFCINLNGSDRTSSDSALHYSALETFLNARELSDFGVFAENNRVSTKGCKSHGCRKGESRKCMKSDKVRWCAEWILNLEEARKRNDAYNM